jgi:hypothetical protein
MMKFVKNKIKILISNNENIKDIKDPIKIVKFKRMIN